MDIDDKQYKILRSDISDIESRIDNLSLRIDEEGFDEIIQATREMHRRLIRLEEDIKDIKKMMEKIWEKI